MVLDAPKADTTFAIRRAIPADAEMLSELAIRSKGHWGYDAEFLSAARTDLTLSSDDLESSLVFVCEARDGSAGFYRLLVLGDGAAELDALFVDPASIGSGVGRRLWEHAVAEATALGCTRLIFQSDPFAEGFYRAMGAQRVGESESTVVPGRMLPLMRYLLR